MLEFRWIKMSLSLILMLQFPAVTVQLYSLVTVRRGDDVVLHCQNELIRDQDKCDGTTWTTSNDTVLFSRGQLHKEAKAQSDRLSLTENCSLVLKKVAVSDAGRYVCRRTRQQDSEVYLFVVFMTEHMDRNKISRFCFVSTHAQCRHTVKWVNEGDKSLFPDMQTSQPYCSAIVTFTKSELHQRSDDLLKCEVTEGDGRKQQFTFRRQSSGDHTGEEATKTTTTMNQTPSEQTKIRDNTMKRNATRHHGRRLLHVIVAVTAAAPLITVVSLIIGLVRWKRTKENTRELSENMGLRLNPEGTESGLETCQNTVEPDDAVSFNSITYVKDCSFKSLDLVNVYGNVGAVTCNTVDSSFSSAESLNEPIYDSPN